MRFLTGLLFAFLWSITVVGQVKVSAEQIAFTNNFDKIGKELQFMKKDKSSLDANDYVFSFEKRDKNYSLYFTILANGKTNGAILTKEGEKLFMRCDVKNGIIQRYERFDPELKQIMEEAYAKGDTIIEKNYTRGRELRAEYRYLNGETIYSYNCSYNSSTDSVVSCLLEDKIKGLYEDYDKGVLTKRVHSKGLPDGMAKKTEYFSATSPVSTEIEFKNGNAKTINKDGSYRTKTWIGNRAEVKEYNKTGKLISTFNEVSISVSSPDH